MLTPIQKADYLVNSAFRYFEKIVCPFCSSANHVLTDRKYLVTRLFECRDCHLLFRHPVEKKEQNKSFYQKEYKELDDITAMLPNEDELKNLIEGDFKQGNKNAGRYIELFRKVIPQKTPLKIIDYGSSWGYMTYQFKNAGYDVQGYEISNIRAAYGKKHLGVDIKTTETELRRGNDIFFSSHVIEHHPDIRGMLDLAKKVLNSDGYFIAISPNGSKSYRDKDPWGFHKSWGKVHPNYLTDNFYRTIFSNNAFYIGSSPFNLEQIANIDDKQFIDRTDSEELILVAKINAGLQGS